MLYYITFTCTTTRLSRNATCASELEANLDQLEELRVERHGAAAAVSLAPGCLVGALLITSIQCRCMISA